MDKKRYVIVTGCRSAAKYTDAVYENLRGDPETEPSLLRMIHETIDFADSKVRPKIVQVHRATSGKDKDLSDALLNSHVLLFQNIQNPIAQNPDIFAAEEIINFMDQFKIPENPIAAKATIRELNLDTRLNDYLMNLAAMELHKSGEYRGFIKSYFMEKGQRKLKGPFLARLIRLFRHKGKCPSLFFQPALRSFIRDVIQPRNASTEILEFYTSAYNLIRRGCRNVTAVWPFSDGRSDRYARGENNETEYLAESAKAIGIGDLLTIRMHSKAQQGDAWKKHGVKVHEIDATDYLAEIIVDKYAELIRQKKLGVTTIDKGGKDGVVTFVKKIRRLALEKGLIENEYDIPVTIMDKKRTAAHSVKEVRVHEGYGLDDPSKLAGMTLLAYDDMIDTAGSLKTYLKDVAEGYNVAGVIVMVEHPVFSYPAVRNLTSAYADGKGMLKEVITLDTIIHPKYPWHTVLESRSLVVAKIKEMFFQQNGIDLPPNPPE